MGTKLGHSALPLGRDAIAKPGLVAVAGARRAQNLSRLSHRSRARILSHLRFSVATGAQRRNAASLLGTDARADGRRLSAILSARRFDLGKLPDEPARGRRIFARGPGGIR